MSSMAAIRPQPKEWFHDENDHSLKSTFVKFIYVLSSVILSAVINKPVFVGSTLVSG